MKKLRKLNLPACVMARTECQLFKLMKDHFFLLVLENSKGKVLDERGKADTSDPFWHTDALYYSQYADPSYFAHH